MKQVFNFGVIIGCILLLQYHSIRFWIEQVGWIGVAWSLLLESVNFWLWFYRQRKIYLVLGFLTALILLVGPLYETSNTLFLGQNQKVYSDRDITDKKEALNQKIIERDRLFNLIASGRIGYRDDYRRTVESIDSLRESISNSGKTRSELRENWQTYLIVIIQAIAIFIFSIVIILAILSLDFSISGVRSIVKEIRWRIEALNSSRSVSIDEIAKRINVTGDTLNHIFDDKAAKRFSLETAEKILERIKKI